MRCDSILIVDQDLEFHHFIDKTLHLMDYAIVNAFSGGEGIHLAYDYHPDLIMLDPHLPDADGYITCKKLREMTDVPIILVTNTHQQSDLLKGFECGADEFIVKPIQPDELRARMQALIRRYPRETSDRFIYNDGHLVIDFFEFTISVHGSTSKMTATELNILKVLVERPRQVISRHDIMKLVWNNKFYDQNLLSTYISSIRKKIRDPADQHDYIHTYWGRGYWFEPRGTMHMNN
jgi:DNA-binding response OmpR family regulator